MDSVVEHLGSSITSHRSSAAIPKKLRQAGRARTHPIHYSGTLGGNIRMADMGNEANGGEVRHPSTKQPFSAIGLERKGKGLITSHIKSGFHGPSFLPSRHRSGRDSGFHPSINITDSDALQSASLVLLAVFSCNLRSLTTKFAVVPRPPQLLQDF